MNIKITAALLKTVAPFAPKDVEKYVPHLQATCEKYEINTRFRVAMFLAQVAHESDSFKTAEEYASGAAYEGRKDLGNTKPGDGRRYKGRGLIQITGRDNYTKCGKALGLDLVNKPEQLKEPAHACTSAGWFWSQKGLNAISDTGSILAATKKINGGQNGLASRQELYKRALAALKEVV